MSGDPQRSYPPVMPMEGAGPQQPPEAQMYAQMYPAGPQYPPAAAGAGSQMYSPQMYPGAAGGSSTQPPFGYGAPPYGYGAPPGAAVGAGGPMPPPRPYGMPYKPYDQTGPWAGGGPVGTGVVPPDVEAQVMHQFADKQVRRGFMRKVFGIVALQLAVTVGVAFVCFFVTPIKSYVQTHPWPFYLSWGLSFGLLLVISCNERLRRSYPANMLFLSLFTLFEAFLVGMITSFFDIEVVALAFLCTCVAVGTLALIATQKWVDITSWGTVLAVPSMILLVLVFVGIFWLQNRIWFLVIAGVAALLASAYIVYDLQLIMGGKQYAISPDEYIFASLSLYLDIVQLFIWILYLVGLSRD